MKVLFCASEVAPFAKTGGLADVTGSLPFALERLGVEVKIMMPRYRGLPARKKLLSEKVGIHFIENETFFNRAGIYGNEQGDYADNLERFSFFCERALTLAKELGFKPDIVHTHDWQTALAAVLLKTKLAGDPFYKKSRTLLTIHNIAYQGQFPHRHFEALRLDNSLFSVDAFEFYGKVNLLKAGLVFADGISTVSPTYAKEIGTKEFGFGLEGVVESRRNRIRGILNGLDTALWNPEKDGRIKKKYSVKDPAGKAACKADLQQGFGWEPDEEVPVFGIVSRLAEQKGLELLSEISDRFLSKKVQFVLLGDGDAVYKTMFRNVAARHPRNSRVFFEYDAALAHRIYAGADFFLMPSYFEPCGLGQMISLRYGTIPVVRHTGGLADTITDVDARPAKGNGIVFASRSPERLLEAMERALKLFSEKARFKALQRSAMKADFSWSRSALEYKKFYQEILK